MPQCEEMGDNCKIGNVEVLRSNAGYYIGYYCKECGPWDRLSKGYFATEEEAKRQLDWNSQGGFEQYITQTHRLHSGGRFTEVLVHDVVASEPIAVFYGANAKLNAKKFISYKKQKEERYVRPYIQNKMD